MIAHRTVRPGPPYADTQDQHLPVTPRRTAGRLAAAPSCHSPSGPGGTVQTFGVLPRFARTRRDADETAESHEKAWA